MLPARARRFAASFLLLLLLLGGCGGRGAISPAPTPAARRPLPLTRMGYAIQAGAFARLENAAHLTEVLRQRGLDATYFAAPKGLYKVRFGDFPTREAARRRAETLRQAGMIDVYYIVSPDEYATAKRAVYGEAYLRAEIVKTAQSFLGLPYLWGGSSPETGFDCSGLAVACYQLNGLLLPRTSREQFQAGTAVDRAQLREGDLVFFSGGSDGKVTHVGLYLGQGRFIHAPGRGKKIRTDSLSGGYYGLRFVGARSYL